MAGLPDYQVGQKGVNLVASPIHTPDGGLLSAQNVEFSRVQGIGGMATRGGLAPLNGVALAGPVRTLSNVPISFPSETDLLVALNNGETNGWKKSTDGAAYTDILLASLPRIAQISKSPVPLVGAGSISAGNRPVTFNQRFYFPGDSYIQYPTANFTAPPVVVWDGALSFTQFLVPANPTSPAGSTPVWVADFYAANGVIYLAVYDGGGSAPDLKGRVLAYDPSNGTLQQIGNRFGDGTGGGGSENPTGFPFCLTSYMGYLWAGTYGVSGNNRGSVYRILPGIETTWTQDLFATLHNGYYMSLGGYAGQLFAATDADASGTAIIQKRTSAGTWTTTLSAPASNVAYFSGLIVFNNLLFAAYYQTGVACLIKKYDGTSWTTDLDVAATYANKAPGIPFVFNGALYWPFLGSDTGASNTTGFLLKRTTGAVWSQPLVNKGIRGCLGQYSL